MLGNDSDSEELKEERPRKFLEKRERTICSEIGCKEKRHGMFYECKGHFYAQHRTEKLFRWSPSNIGYATIKRILECYPDRIDCSKIKESDISSGFKSHIPLICVKCQCSWSPSIGSVINNGSGCPYCSECAPWSIDKFLSRMKDRLEINCVDVKEHHINTKNSRVPVSCNYCPYAWTPTIHSLVNHNRGCPNCAGLAPYTLIRFLDKMKDRLEIDCSEVKEHHINNKNSKVPLSCNICPTKWTPSITNVVNNRSGCPGCLSNKAIKAIENYLDHKNVSYELEKTFEGLEDKKPLRIDVYIPEMKRISLPVCIEFDGDYPGSHFSYNNEKQKAKHIKSVRRDRMKDKFIPENGMHLIRIPHTSFRKTSQEEMDDVLRGAFLDLRDKDNPSFYCSDLDPYLERDLRLEE